MMKSAVVASVFLALVSTSAFADSETLSPRLTADVAPRGGWSVGIFNPLRIAVTDSIELEAHPLLIAVSPHLGVRQKLWSHPSGWRLTGAYGISVPTPALRLTPPFGLGSYFTPSCLVTAHDSAQAATCKKPGWFAIPRLGVVASYGTNAVYTLAADVAVGVHFSGEKLRPFDTFTPVELLFAPMSRGFRVHLGGRYDRAILSWLRVSAELDLYVMGAGPAPGRSPFVVAAHVGADIRTSTHTRLTVGAKYFNSDLRQSKLETDDEGFSRRTYVRSNDAYPTIDFIWTY